MKQLALLLALIFTSRSIAGLPPTTLSGQSQATKPTTFTFRTPLNQATQVSGVQSLIETGNLNALANPGFEHSTATTSWTTTILTAASESTVIHSGAKALKLSASSSTGNTTQSVTTNASQLANTQGIASAFVKTSMADVYVCAMVDAVEQNCVLVVNDSNWKLIEIPFVFGSTSYGVRVKNITSATGDVYVDDAYAGIMPIGRMPEVAQAQIAGNSYFAGSTGCSWSRTSTTIGAFGATAACPGPTIYYSSLGDWQTTDSDLPRQTINNLPAGTYKATFFVAPSGSTQITSVFSIYDGTQTCLVTPGGGTNTFSIYATVSCIFNYTSSGNRSFELYTASTAGASAISNDLNSGVGRSTQFILEYYPPASKIYSLPCQSDTECTNEFSAKVTSTGTVSDENLDFINGNCTNANPRVCTFNTSFFAATPNCVVAPVDANSNNNIQITAQSASSISVSTAGAAVLSQRDFNIYCQRSTTGYKVKNQITGTFANVVATPGIAKPKVCYASYGGVSATLASPTLCSIGSCVEVEDTCGAFTPPSFTSTGLYGNLTAANGTFANSSPITCDCSAYSTTTLTATECTVVFKTSNQSWSTNSSGGGIWDIYTYGGSGSVSNSYFRVRCEGTAP